MLDVFLLIAIMQGLRVLVSCSLVSHWFGKLSSPAMLGLSDLPVGYPQHPEAKSYARPLPMEHYRGLLDMIKVR